MTHEILTLQCCDSIAPFNTYGQQLSDKTDCFLRSIRVQQLTNNDLNWGMVFCSDHNRNADFPGGFNRFYSSHAWTEKDGVLYESCRQWENCFNKELDLNQYVMMFDISHFVSPKSKKELKELIKNIQKRLIFAHSKGIKYVYMCGFQIDNITDPNYGLVESANWNWANREFDTAELVVNKFMAGEEVPLLYF